MEILTAIYDGRVAKTYRTCRMPKIGDILVNLNDVKSKVLEAGDDLLSAEDCARTLNINLSAMRKIMQAGVLGGGRETEGPGAVCPLAASRDEVEAFDRDFVSLNAVRLKFGSSSAAIAVILAATRVFPAFPTRLTDVTLYLRADIERAADAIYTRIAERRIQRRR